MKKSIKKTAVIVILAGIIILSGVALYMFNMPHRDVQKTSADYEITAGALVKEYIDNRDKANQKYLQEEGESKILSVTGVIAGMRMDLNNQKVIVLKDPGSKAGVSCTFTKETNNHTGALEEGQTITVKGVIRSGAGYDEDLELYEDVIMEKCDIVMNEHT